jgi:hypothetical protein
VIGLTRAAELSYTIHCLVILLCVPVLVGVSYSAFRLIEAPAMAAVPGVTEWLEDKLGNKSMTPGTAPK